MRICVMLGMVAAATAFVVATSAGRKYWSVEPLPRFEEPVAAAEAHGADLRVSYARAVVAEIAEYQDEAFAYLMFDHWRQSDVLRGSDVLLAYSRGDDESRYRILAAWRADFEDAAAAIARLRAAGLSESRWNWMGAAELQRFERQTYRFVAAYNLPARRPLSRISSARLAQHLQRFVRFKSNVDPRVRRRIAPIPAVLSRDEAGRLARDIIAVAEFYSLPLEFFLGVGAMENNFMNVRGDLANTAWKRRPDPGDEVLQRRKGRVQVRNDSAGVWQITRETLRYAHDLYRKDNRDYSRLPERLIPPYDLDINNVQAAVLTTYAGLLFRDLLGLFAGDVLLAAGAYNGGVRHPNLRYSSGVETAARSARQTLERLDVLDGRAAVSRTWIAPQ